MEEEHSEEQSQPVHDSVGELPTGRSRMLRYFLLGGSIVWLLPVFFYVFYGRPLGACVNAIGAFLSLVVLWLFLHHRISYLAATRSALTVGWLGLFAESFLVGQGDSQSAWYLVILALAAGYLCAWREILFWGVLTGFTQLLIHFLETYVQMTPEYVIEGWELSLGQVVLTGLCATFAFLSRRQADVRLEQVLQSERYIREQSRLLEVARDQAVAATQAKSRFLSTVSHEIRTPLYGILGAAQSIDLKGLGETDAESVTTIVQSGELLLAVLGDILDSAKLDAGELSLHHRSFSLEETLEAACRLVRPLMERKGLGLEMAIAEGTPNRWLGDDLRLRQIILNLLNNACKFSSQGTVTLSASGETGRLMVAVKDEGIGISEEDQGTLFKPFRQIAEGDARRHDGSGLGLWIVRRLSALMNGEVSVLSAPGEGSTFTVTLPLIATADTRTKAKPEVPKNSRSLKVLVVDDNPVNRKVSLNLLKRLGHTAEAVEGGEEALRALGSTEYQAVLMDLQMPDMDGIETTRRIRCDATIVQPFVIAFSADVQAGKKLEIGKHAFDAFLGKPLRLQQLGETLESVEP